jgi:hypothetical protein
MTTGRRRRLHDRGWRRRVSSGLPRQAACYSLFALAKQRRQHFLVVKKELEEVGVEPVFKPKKIGGDVLSEEGLFLSGYLVTLLQIDR